MGKGKKIVAGRTTVKEPEEIQFHYDFSEYDSFKKEGFQPPPINERFDVREREFLKRVNLDYGKVRVKILVMVRQKAVDLLRLKEGREKST